MTATATVTVTVVAARSLSSARVAVVLVSAALAILPRAVALVAVRALGTGGRVGVAAPAVMVAVVIIAADPAVATETGTAGVAAAAVTTIEVDTMTAPAATTPKNGLGMIVLENVASTGAMANQMSGAAPTGLQEGRRGVVVASRAERRFKARGIGRTKKAADLVIVVAATVRGIIVGVARVETGLRVVVAATAASKTTHQHHLTHMVDAAAVVVSAPEAEAGSAGAVNVPTTSRVYLSEISTKTSGVQDAGVPKVAEMGRTGTEVTEAQGVSPIHHRVVPAPVAGMENHRRLVRVLPRVPTLPRGVARLDVPRRRLRLAPSMGAPPPVVLEKNGDGPV